MLFINYWFVMSINIHFEDTIAFVLHSGACGIEAYFCWLCRYFFYFLQHWFLLLKVVGPYILEVKGAYSSLHDERLSQNFFSSFSSIICIIWLNGSKFVPFIDAFHGQWAVEISVEEKSSENTHFLLNPGKLAITKDFIASARWKMLSSITKLDTHINAVHEWQISIFIIAPICRLTFYDMYAGTLFRSKIIFNLGLVRETRVVLWGNHCFSGTDFVDNCPSRQWLALRVVVMSSNSGRLMESFLTEWWWSVNSNLLSYIPLVI